MKLRLLPLLGIAATALLGLKLLSFMLGPDSNGIPLASAVAQEAETTDVAAEGDLPPPPPLDEAAPPDSALPNSLEIGGSAAERAVLESLGKRRENLQAQEGQLDLREKLLKATEDRIQKRVDELKKLEERIEASVGKKEERERAQVAGLVTMYENMKPKDAARIFDRLSMPVLLKVVQQMNPRKMAAILAKMSPDSAEKLTVAIAEGGNARMEPEMPAMAQATPTAQAPVENELPKIPSN